MQVTRLACLVVVSAMFGCGGGGNGGTTNPPPPPPPPPPTRTLGSITTSPTSLNLAAGNSQTITVTALDTQGAVITNAGLASFSIPSGGGAAIAEVDASGSVLGLRSGTGTVNVSLTLAAVTRTATVALTVTGTLPAAASVSTTQGDIFTPSRVAIGQGGQVTWTFGGVIHNVTFGGGAGAPASIGNSSSSQQSRTFTQVGDFAYNCTLHPGMNGSVIVR